MIIIIDAYNFLRHNNNNETISESRYKAFINSLTEYGKQKNHKILIVFDGYSSSRPEFANKHVEVIYPGPKKSADNYIINYLQKIQNKDISVVTSDNKLCQEVNNFKVSCVSVELFRELLRDIPSNSNKYTNSKIIKYETEEENEELDMLMLEASKNIKAKDTPEELNRNKQNKLSKQDKEILKLLKKL